MRDGMETKRDGKVGKKWPQGKRVEESVGKKEPQGRRLKRDSREWKVRSEEEVEKKTCAWMIWKISCFCEISWNGFELASERELN